MSNKKNKFHERNIRKAEKIQESAKNNNLPNGIKREITISQALSILFRSQQLKRESSYHPHLISDKEKARQIDVCYEQRSRQG
jgi:hypothetical protein